MLSSLWSPNRFFQFFKAIPAFPCIRFTCLNPENSQKAFHEACFSKKTVVELFDGFSLNIFWKHLSKPLISRRNVHFVYRPFCLVFIVIFGTHLRVVITMWPEPVSRTLTLIAMECYRIKVVPLRLNFQINFKFLWDGPGCSPLTELK